MKVLWTIRSTATRNGALAMALGAICVPALMGGQARADLITDQIVRNVVQNILQNVRDQIQRRRLQPPSRALRFSDEDTNSASNASDPFSALAFSKIPTKAAPPQPPQQLYLDGANLSLSGDESRASGVTTRSIAATGAFDITRIGIFDSSDAISVIFTGSGIWSRSPGIDSTTSVGAGTIAYVNGGFSTDFTVNGNWTRSSLAASGITASSGVSYSPNVQYKFDLADAWFVEPTVGVSYTQTFNADFGTQTGDSTEVHGGVRVGTETVWNGVRVQPSISGAAFSIVSQTGGGGQIGPGGNPIPGAGGVATGQVGGRGSGKLNLLWTETFSSYVEAHGSGIAGTTAYGAMGGVRWTF